MSVADHVFPFRGMGWRHVPAGTPFGPLDTRIAARSSENRWNLAGEPTLYLARDPGLVIAEFGRHIRTNRNESLVEVIRPRQHYRIELALDQVIDLRSAESRSALGLDADPAVFVYLDIARSTAGFLRHAIGVEAILAPSMALFDQPRSWMMALFIENLGDGPDGCVVQVESGETFELKQNLCEMM